MEKAGLHIFDEANVSSVIDKKPVLLSYSGNGASGPSGLMLVIFEDGSTYAYSTLYSNSDSSLIEEITKAVPEFDSLLHFGKNLDYRREKHAEDFAPASLGQGNKALMDKAIFERYEGGEKERLFSFFKRMVREYSGYELKEIFQKVEQYFHEGNI